MPDLNMDEIEKRYEKATPGEWGWSQQACYHTSPGIAIYSGTLSGKKSIRIASIRQQANTVLPKEQREANADFIAHARTDIPALVAEVKRMREEAKGREELRIRQLAAISTAALGYLKEGEVIEDCLWTAALHDVIALYEKYNRLFVNESQATDNALEEAAKICDRLKVAECLARQDEDDDIWNDALDQAAEKIRALKTNQGA